MSELAERAAKLDANDALAGRRDLFDLDDGVKMNYTKFGDLLAESKAITGGKDDE